MGELSALLGEPLRGKLPAIAAVAARWAAVNPRGALAYIDQMAAHENLIRMLRRAVVEVWLQRDPGAAPDFMRDAVARNESYSDALDLVFRALIRTNGAPYDALRAYLSRLPQKPSSYSGLAMAMADGMENNLAAAEAFIATLLGSEDRGMLYSILGGKKAGVKGLAILAELTAAGTDPDAQKQLSGAVTGLAGKFPAEITAWLETQPAHEDFNHVRLRLAVNAYRDDPEKALRILRHAHANPRAQQSLDAILEYWLRKDFAAAKTWALASDLPPDFLAEQIEKVTAPVARVDYANQLNATLQIADERERRRAQWAIRGWIQQDRAAATQWMAENTRTDADREFFERMARTPDAPPGPQIFLH